MKCFYHPDRDAVAICKNCNRGLCQEDAVVVGDGIACKDKCEDKVRQLNALLDRNIATVQRAGTTYSLNSLLYVIMGIVFIGMGLLFTEYLHSSLMSLLMVVGGGFFACYGAYILFLRSRVIRKSQ